MEKYGVTEMETTGIFETNQKVIQNWKNYENIQHKRKRCWKKTF
jgi:limonene-1,2-epoxide hydrolase